MEKYNFNSVFIQTLGIKYFFYFLVPQHFYIKIIQLRLCILNLFLKKALRYFYKTTGHPTELQSFCLEIVIIFDFCWSILKVDLSCVYV